MPKRGTAVKKTKKKPVPSVIFLTDESSSESDSRYSGERNAKAAGLTESGDEDAKVEADTSHRADTDDAPPAVQHWPKDTSAFVERSSNLAQELFGDDDVDYTWPSIEKDATQDSETADLSSDDSPKPTRRRSAARHSTRPSQSEVTDDTTTSRADSVKLSSDVSSLRSQKPSRGTIIIDDSTPFVLPKRKQTVKNTVPVRSTALYHATDMAFIPPNQQRNMRACMVCSIVRTETQFRQSGCPNCESFLELTANPEQIQECTSQVFDGLLTVSDTSRSWVARHQRLEGYVPGVYAVQVEGILPDEVIAAAENAGVHYVPRDGSVSESLPTEG